MNEPDPVYAVPGVLKTRISLSDMYAVGENQPAVVEATNTDEGTVVEGTAVGVATGGEDDPPPPPPPPQALATLRNKRLRRAILCCRSLARCGQKYGNDGASLHRAISNLQKAITANAAIEEKRSISDVFQSSYLIAWKDHIALWAEYGRHVQRVASGGSARPVSRGLGARHPIPGPGASFNI